MTEDEDVTWAIYRLADKGHYLGQVDDLMKTRQSKLLSRNFRLPIPTTRHVWWQGWWLRQLAQHFVVRIAGAKCLWPCWR